MGRDQVPKGRGVKDIEQLKVVPIFHKKECGQMKRCPFCAEEIQDMATKCRFCGEWLSEGQPASEPDQKWVGQLCPDGVCTGHIGASGRCSVCGLTVSDAKMAEEQREKSQQIKRIESLSPNITPEMKQNSALWGERNTAITCPQCQKRGYVWTKQKKRKKGISGAKATGALLTFGSSVIFTRLSRKESVTQAHCTYCNSTWDF